MKLQIFNFTARQDAARFFFKMFELNKMYIRIGAVVWRGRKQHIAVVETRGGRILEGIQSNWKIGFKTMKYLRKRCMQKVLLIQY